MSLDLSSLTTAVFKPQRKFGSFVAQVTIEEIHTDRTAITQHPVEQGATITDHSYSLPSELVVRMAWSNSAVAAGLTSLGGLAQLASSDLSGDLNYMITQYNNIRALVKSRVPFSIVTGKRKYKNMICISLHVPTEAATEHALFVTAICKEIIIVQTQTATLPPADVQATPKETAAPTDMGSQQPTPTALTESGGVVSPAAPLPGAP